MDITMELQHFTVWLWVLPSDDGFGNIAYGLSYPSWIVLSGSDTHPDMEVLIGCPQDRHTTCLSFNGCWYDWVWMIRYDAYALEGGISGKIQIVPSEWFGSPIMAGDCLHGEKPARILNGLHFNEVCVVGAEEYSWGAIKDLFRD